jgi:sugar phosphate isomerase/epimerase
MVEDTCIQQEDRPMIHQLLAAPKHIPDEAGIAFALKHKLGYEIAAFSEPQMLDESANVIPNWLKMLSPLSTPLGLHGPVYDLNPVSLDPQIASASRYRYQQAVAVCQALGCRYLVVHSQYNSLFKVAKVQREWIQASIDFWKQFASETLEPVPSLTLVIENFMEEEPGQLRQLVESVGHPQIKACLDTGHANIYSKADIVTWLNELEHQVVYIHSHNNYGRTDDHRGYQYGTLDMETFLNHLILSPYKVNLALEVFNLPELEETLCMVQQFLSLQQKHLPERSFLI